MKIGHSERIVCPKCGDNTSCSETQIDAYTVRQYCFRASCGHRRTYLTATGGTVFESVALPENTHEPYSGELTPLTQDQQAYFKDRYGLYRWQTCNAIKQSGEWYALRINDQHGRCRGWQLRWPWNDPNPPTPKAKTYLNKAVDNGISWYKSGSLRATVIVEDCLSALRLQAKDRNAVALLGNGLNESRVAELQQGMRNMRHIAIALDNDATGQAFNLARKWGPAFDSCRVLVLPGPDIKDMTTEELEVFCDSI